MDDLIARVRNGDVDARDELFATVRPLLRQWAEGALNAKFNGRLDASDLTQITMLEVFEKFQTFLGKTNAEFERWLWRSLERNALDAVRGATAKKRNAQREQPFPTPKDDSMAAFDVASDQSAPSQKAIQNEDRGRLEAALAELSDSQRTMIQLVHLKGVPVKVAGKTLNLRPANAAKTLQRGMAKLRAILNPADESNVRVDDEKDDADDEPSPDEAEHSHST